MCKSEIQTFYAGQTIFLTGGTGFLGKVLLEKLLRLCWDVKTIYILIREKQGKSAKERLSGIFDYPCFEPLKKMRTNFDEKVKLIGGDLVLPHLGLSPEDRRTLQAEVTVVIHAAANVKFDQSLRIAANINIRSTRYIVELAKGMPQLKALAYVSTAYSYCPLKEIEEKFYDPPITADNLFSVMDALNDELLDKMTPLLMKSWPNTYVYTKAIAEDVIRNEGKHLPIAQIRPAIVTTSVDEPIPGWIDNFYGVVGITVGASLGVLKSMNINPDYIAHIVPVDYVVNNVLAAVWDVSTRKTGDIPIYNYTGSEKKLITWSDYVNYVETCAWDYPTDRIVWYYCFKLRASTLWHNVAVFFLHTVLAYVADFILMCLGKPTMAVKSYKKINKLLALISYFGLSSFKFTNDNVKKLWTKMSPADRKSFNFNMDHLDWAKYIENGVIGGRVYLLKDPLETIPKGKKKIRLLQIAHYSVIGLFFYLLYKIIMFVINLFF